MIRRAHRGHRTGQRLGKSWVMDPPFEVGLATGSRRDLWGSSLRLAFLFFFLAHDLHLENGSPRWIGRHRLFAIHHLLDHLTIGKLFDHLAGTHTQRAERSETRFDSGIRNFFGVKLQIDPAVHTHSHDLLQVAGPWSKRESVQGVDGALLLLRTRRKSFVFFLRE